MRVGFGYDIHLLVQGRPLILGGVEIPYLKGLSGHSDADVLCHAVSDALLGAAAIGDIGVHFPDTDNAYKGISSIALLEKVVSMIVSEGYRIINIDSTIVAQAPRLSSFRDTMRENIAKAAGISPLNVSVKATTNEGADATGRGEAIAVYAVAMLE